MSKDEWGKQITRILSGSFEHRCKVAGLSLTLGPTWIETTWKHLFGTCSAVTTRFVNQRKRKHDNNTKRKSSIEYKRARREKRYHLAPSTADRHYGPKAVTTNTIDQQELHKLCKEYLESLQITPQQASQLTEATIGQDPSPNSLWQQLERARLTASRFGTVVKRHKNFEGLVESIIYKPPPDSAAALEWGRSHEDIARQTYITTKKEQFGQLYQVKKTGIHISVENPWLAASPDGLIEDPSENDGRRYGILKYNVLTLQEK